MSQPLSDRLKKRAVAASAPCRIDMGGTLDIAPIYFPLRHLAPATFNIAVDLRTYVAVVPGRSDRVQVTSHGIGHAAFPPDRAPFDHPLGLMFAIAAYFNLSGVHVVIHSTSPPRSALGGSSAAAVAMIAAILSSDPEFVLSNATRRTIALLAHALEESVARAHCGRQDQLAAAFGGVNAWRWRLEDGARVFERQPPVIADEFEALQRRILLAYSGIPHESHDINARWIHQFIRGETRRHWRQVARYSHNFIDAIGRGHYKDAAAAMNAEVALRCEMTPDVLDPLGRVLVEAARAAGCGARFTGAGAGGCLWAVGDAENIDKLRPMWEGKLEARHGAALKVFQIDDQGIRAEDDLRWAMELIDRQD